MTKEYEHLIESGIVSYERVIAASASSPKRRRKANGKIRHPSGLVYRRASLTDARAVRWAWSDRILVGYLSILLGTEGIGKGNVVAWMLARITKGELEGCFKDKPRRVAVVGDEDDFNNIWTPRLHVAQADLSLVDYIEAGPEGNALDVRTDASRLRDFVDDRSTGALYLDQLLDNLGATNSWKDKEVRDALAPLRRVSREMNLASIGTMHPNKRQGSFRERITGTTAFNAVSKSGLLVTEHPMDPTRRILVRPRGSYSKEPPAFEFRIEEVEVKRKSRRRADRGEPIITSRIEGVRESSLTAAVVLDGMGQRLRAESKVGIARAALTAIFNGGGRLRAADVQERIYQESGIPARIVTEAATQLGIRKTQEGFPGIWWWEWPQ
jgi:hypothetical protein